MRAQIKGCLGQMAHRRQIAQWVGTRTTHPGGTGFEPRRGLMIGISPEDCRGRLDPFPRYLILRVKRRFHQTRRRVANKVGGIQEDHPGGVASPGSRPVLAQNQGVSPRASRRGFFRPKKGVPGFFGVGNRPVFIENLGIACGHSRRVFFFGPKNTPLGFSAAKKA